MLLGNVDGYVGLSLEVDQNLPLRAKHLVRLRVMRNVRLLSFELLISIPAPELFM